MTTDTELSTDAPDDGLITTPDEPGTSPGTDDRATSDPDNDMDNDTITYASWSRQLYAYGIDVVLPAIAITSLVGIILTTGVETWPTIVCGIAAVAIVGFLVFNVVVLQGRSGLTMGKSAMSITTESAETGDPIGIVRSGARQVTHVIDTVPLLVGWFYPLRDRKRRTFADIIHGTRVITTDRAAPTRTIGWSIGVLAATVLAVGTLVATQYFDQYRQDQASAAAYDDVARVAQSSTVALLSYQPDSVEADLNSAAKTLTGGFLDYYSKYTKEVVIPAAKEKKVDTQAEAVGAGVVSADAHNATVLVFINQTTTTVDNPQPTKVASTVQVNLVHVDGHWLVDEFKPI
ncbi:RDD family protein [Williamsia sp. 1138]|uniref:RDD family protein n=1 Tax=Williamsia sp. 1138 TaxID=1903117 RepID=UPI000A115A8A|nr:RDD family protein [Williamsia sp. 1138]OZG28870.1 RDD family protein [Williamsia sp. 1138]